MPLFNFKNHETNPICQALFMNSYLAKLCSVKKMLRNINLYSITLSAIIENAHKFSGARIGISIKASILCYAVKV